MATGVPLTSGNFLPYQLFNCIILSFFYSEREVNTFLMNQGNIFKRGYKKMISP